MALTGFPALSLMSELAPESETLRVCNLIGGASILAAAVSSNVMFLSMSQNTVLVFNVGRKLFVF